MLHIGCLMNPWCAASFRSAASAPSLGAVRNYLPLMTLSHFLYWLLRRTISPDRYLHRLGEDKNRDGCGNFFLFFSKRIQLRAGSGQANHSHSSWNPGDFAWGRRNLIGWHIILYTDSKAPLKALYNHKTTSGLVLQPRGSESDSYRQWLGTEWVKDHKANTGNEVVDECADEM